MASLVPPPRANLTRIHGVFAPGAKLRPFLVPQADYTDAEQLAYGRPLQFPAGLRWSYSNTSYVLLGILVKTADRPSPAPREAPPLRRPA
ncbi:serine hydrolase [Corallococcus sp. AB045]|uniref:serine hydrolase n=1 Tax=Corallococcus sp. AB045 TaxID=2316719 RepID=UPI0011C34529